MSKNKIVLVSAISIVILILIFIIGGKKLMKVNNSEARVSNFEKIVPKSSLYFSSYDFDFEKAYQKGIGTSKKRVSTQYLDLQSKYDEVFSMYLMQKIPAISVLDKSLSELYIKALSKKTPSELATEEKYPVESYYRSLSHIKSNYIYLASNIYIERLSKKDIELLKDCSLMNDNEKTALLKMVSRTYAEVTRSEKGPTVSKWSEEVGSKTSTLPGTTLVIWLSYNDFYDSKGNYINEEKSSQALEKIVGISQKYSSIFSHELGCDVEILVHNE